MEEGFMIGYAVDDAGIATVTWDLPGRPVNILSMESRLKFVATIEQALADDAVKGIIITSAKKEFIAGADLTLLQTFRGKAAQEIMDLMHPMRTLLRRMEKSPKPVVAAINGTALGGGLEVCLACHHRIAADRPDSVYGLPEVGLGLLPGAGGTQRLPRLIGIKAALPLLMEGTRVSAQEAHAKGFIDQLVPADQLLTAARDWLLANPTAQQPWDKKGFAVPGGDVATLEMNRLFMTASSKAHAETRGNYPAPAAILSCVFEGLRVPIDAGLSLEFRHFAGLVRGEVAQSTIRTFFFAMNDARKLKDRPSDVPTASFSKLGILGAGTMGGGIAQVAAEGGLEVVLLDMTAEAATAGRDRLAKGLDKLVSRGKIAAEKRDTILSRITATADFQDLAGCEAVIEAVFEDRAVKDDVIRRTLAVTGDEILFGSNTSKIPISELAVSTSRPDRFIGMHFFSPVPRMALLEIIKGQETSQETLAQTLDLCKVLTRVPIVVNDAPGFFTSRCVSTYLNEGIALLREGVSPALIENVGRQAGMPMGPLALADGVGVDVMHKVRSQEAADRGLDYPAGVEFPVVEKLISLGRTGMKSGQGFYDYAADGSKTLWPELAVLYPVAASQPSPDSIRQRLLHVQAVEASRCFDQGVIENPAHADIGSVLGWSFAKHTGGVCSYIDSIGVVDFVAQCDALAAQHGERYLPPSGLRERAAQNRPFHAA
jgi:3-hydroxyacyl-CoA dehydrogenase/enoyl-CoA hydratase/3-hydroxybutyryl-CoA epimerase